MTAPALPGAAPDPARLPPEVEAALDDVYVVEGGWPYGNSVHGLAALRTAIARALGGDGKPVAWAVYHLDGTLPAFLADNARGAESWRGGSECYRVAPLFTRPAATGADIDRAVREAVEQEREAIAAWHDAEADRITRECAESRRIVRENPAAFAGISTSLEHEEAQAETHRECAAAIRTRGAKS